MAASGSDPQADTDLIARLYPLEGKPILGVDTDFALWSVKDDRNSSRYIEVPRITHNGSPYLEFRFKQGPRTSSGFVFGTNPNCDIVLEKLRGVSSYHFLRDFSAHETTVMYDGEGEECRSQFRWILGGYDIPDKAHSIIIQFSEVLKFEIAIARQNIYSPEYANNVAQFLQGTASAEDCLLRLSLQTHLSTLLPNVAQNPGSKPVGIVQEPDNGDELSSWDVSTGALYRANEITGNDSDEQIATLQNLKHAKLVRYIDVYQTKDRQFVATEGYNLQNLSHVIKTHGRLNRTEIIQILHQTSKALVYLHRQSSAHQDLQPRNLLVHQRNPPRIALSPPGLQTPIPDPTELLEDPYAAPEMLDGRTGYTPAADIWALGVTALQLVTGDDLPGAAGTDTDPDPDPEYGYALELFAAVGKLWARDKSDGLVTLIRTMLAWEADCRPDAEECLGDLNALLLEMGMPGGVVADPVQVGAQQTEWPRCLTLQPNSDTRNVASKRKRDVSEEDDGSSGGEDQVSKRKCSVSGQDLLAAEEGSQMTEGDQETVGEEERMEAELEALFEAEAAASQSR